MKIGDQVTRMLAGTIPIKGMYWCWFIRWWLVDNVTMLCIWAIHKLNPHKDRCLSQHLFDLAEDYNTRPDGD